MNIIVYEASTGHILSKREIVEQPSRSVTCFKPALTFPYIMVA